MLCAGSAVTLDSWAVGLGQGRGCMHVGRPVVCGSVTRALLVAAAVQLALVGAGALCTEGRAAVCWCAAAAAACLAACQVPAHRVAGLCCSLMPCSGQARGTRATGSWVGEGPWCGGGGGRRQGSSAHWVVAAAVVACHAQWGQAL